MRLANQIHIPWTLLLFSSIFEFAIDYSRYSVVNKHLIFIVVLLFCLIPLLLKNKYIIYRHTANVFIFALFCFILMLLYSFDFSYTIHWIALIFAIGIPIYIVQFNNIRRFLLYIGVILALSCILQMIFPEIFYYIGGLFLNSAWEEEARTFESYGVYTGLSYQTGFTASFIAIAIACYFSLQKRQFWNWVVIIILYIGVALTSKRMMFMISVIIPFITKIISMSLEGKRISRIMITIPIILVISIIILNILLPYFSDWVIAQRFLADDLDTEQLTSGRNILFAQAWKLFLSNPIFGIGWGNFSDIAGTSVHNVYLQVLAETGLIGFIIFMACIINSLSLTVQSLKLSRDKNHDIQGAVVCCLLIQLVFLLGSLTGNPLYELPSRVLYLFSCCTCISIYNNLKTKHVSVKS